MSCAVTLWTASTVDWAQNPGLQTCQLFERVYPTTEAIARLRVAVGLPRAESARNVSHHERWVALLTEAARSGLMLNLAAEVLHDTSLQIWRPRLEELLGDELPDAHLARVSKYGLPPEQADRSAEIESMGLQGFDSRSSRILTSDELIEAQLAARRRVGAIERGGHVIASGCLVGPNLFLTAGHAMRDVRLDTAIVVFDYTATNVAAPNRRSRARVLEVAASSEPALSEEGPNNLDWDVPLEFLDFALLRLDRSIADERAPDDREQRGFYSMLEDAYDTADAGHLTIFHHPRGLPQAQESIGVPVEFNPKGTRFRYSARTDKGSSGSPIIDPRGRLVGLHHYSTLTRAQAVPIWLIAQALRVTHPDLLDSQGLGQSIAPAPDPDIVALDRVLSIGVEPFVDREPFRDTLVAVSSPNGGRRIMVRGEERTGVSTSYRLIAYAASRTDTRAALLIDLKRYIDETEADRLTLIMEEIVGELLALDSGAAGHVAIPSLDDIQQFVRSVHQFRQFCRRTLRQSERQWWFFIDSIDDAELMTGGIADLVLDLLTLTDDRQIDLRVVLAGRAVDRLPAAFQRAAITDDARGISRSDSDDWVRRKATSEGRTVDDQLLVDELDVLFPAGQHPFPDDVALRLPAIYEQVTA